MGKRKSAVHRTTKASHFTNDIQPGHVITGADMLGIDDRAAEALPPAGWLRGEASPFGMDVFDCRRVASTYVSMTGDPAIADSFSRQRRSDGTEYIGTTPEDPAYFDLALEIPLQGEELRDGPLFNAAQMEDKWDIYRYGDIYYFVRSWTGTLIHLAHGHGREGVLYIDGIITSSQRIDGRDRMFFAREVFFLIVNHALGFEFPHPVPSYRAGDEDSIVQFSFSEFGRKGWYAAVAEVPPANGAAPAMDEGQTT